MELFIKVLVKQQVALTRREGMAMLGKQHGRLTGFCRSWKGVAFISHPLILSTTNFLIDQLRVRRKYRIPAKTKGLYSS